MSKLSVLAAAVLAARAALDAADFAYTVAVNNTPGFDPYANSYNYTETPETIAAFDARDAAWKAYNRAVYEESQESARRAAARAKGPTVEDWVEYYAGV